jgi:hypothetical protein
MDARFRTLTPSSRRLAALLAVFFVGCKSNQKYDLIEAELRDKDRQLAAAKAELEYYRGMGQAMQTSRSERAGNVPMLPLQDITLATGTGGAELDGLPGDDALEVFLVPRDTDGAAIKVTGRVTVFAHEISPGGTKHPIGRWDIKPEELRTHWHRGLISIGYVLILQWDQLPSTDKLRITVQMTTLDGRVYEVDKDVTVRPKSARRLEELPPPAVRIGRISPLE